MSATDLPILLRYAVAPLLAVAALPTAWAAGPTITEADMERTRRAQPTVTEQDIEQARRKYSLPPMDTPAGTSTPTGPSVDAVPQPVTRSPIDLEALARGYASQADAMEAAQGLAKGPGLLVFVSLAMPRPTLQRLIDQAARARASVILRGLVNGSLRQTVAQVQPLIGQRQVAVQIDPQAFDRFAITRVPSFVLVRDGTRPESCASGSCAPPEAFLRTAGDVSLDYALEHMQRAAPAFRADAAPFLARLRN
ncbi:MAG: type-F conjugative transfer system pilin assembly protein TrbC [Proteobacteria bacterium]|nr:type-F conjugative transfer system pilin assembly protein TrbC [Pseudomonadota bacterium]